jgi:hypothetical protein
MAMVNFTAADVEFVEPRPRVVADLSGDAKESFSIEVAGLGQLTGIAYTVPAHASGSIKAKLKVSALSSEDVKALNDLAMTMVNASRQQETKEVEKTSASADISLWSWFFGGGGAHASYEKTRENMVKYGLSEENITTLMNKFAERAAQMSVVEVDLFVNNLANDYSVSGDLYLYVVSGEIKTSKGTQQYRMLADSGAAGGPPPSGGGAPSSGNIIKL